MVKTFESHPLIQHKVFILRNINTSNYIFKTIVKELTSLMVYEFTKDLELITKFAINKTFDQAFQESKTVQFGENNLLKFKVLSYDDLILSKIKSGRPKDLLDVQQLQSIHKKQ